MDVIGLLDQKVSPLFHHAPEPLPNAGRSDAAPASNPIPYDYRKEYLPRTEFVFKRVQQLFLGMKREADKHSIPILVVMIPEKIQLERDPFPGLEADLEKPQRLFSQFFQENGIAYLDLLPSFRERADKEMFYFKRDEHFNAAGHKLAASLLAQWLQSHDAPLSPSH
jgi:lysophospholipase L1-like esterase